MIFHYPNNKFIEDGRNNRLLIEGFAFLIANPTSFAAIQVDAEPTEDSATYMQNVEFLFEGGVLKVFAGGKRITNITKLLFIMSESEVSAAQDQMYRRNMAGNNEEVGRQKVFSPDVKLALQAAIEKLAVAHGITIAENINFFNDKFILYMFPLLRTMANSSTNFYKVLEDLRFIEDSSGHNDGYMLPHAMMEQTNISDALKILVGTSSKTLTRFVAHNVVRKTDLVKSLSPQLLDILINHSGKIFASGTGQVEPNVKILTCYEDILLDVFLYVRFVMDMFSNNIDHANKFLTNRKKAGENYRTNRKVANFLAENLTPAKIFNVIDDQDNYLSTLGDVVNQFSEYKEANSIPGKLRTQYPNGLELPKNWKTLKELHDKVSADYNKIKAEDNNKVIEYSPTEFQLHGMVKENIELMLPSEGSVLVSWGKSQSHCVASYADRAAMKSCIIMGVKVDGVHTYTLELRSHEIQRPIKAEEQLVNDVKEILNATSPAIERETVLACDVVQFRGNHNSNPEPEHKAIVLDMLKEVFLGGINGRDMMNEIMNLQRALEAGNYNAAPDQLAQGGALQVEALNFQGIDAQLRANGV